MNASVLDMPTLVLNRDWLPIQTMSTRKAIGLVASGSAHIIDPVTFEVHDLDSWDAMSRAQSRFSGYRIRSMRLALAPLEVIVLKRYRGRGERRVVFSRRNISRRDRHACQYCGEQRALRDLTIDHVVPRSRGGRSTWENCVVACVSCNSRKANRLPEEAGMRLNRKPRRPSWMASIDISRPERQESWNRFISRAYWDVELKP